MERIFGVPTTPIATAVAALWLLCALVVVVLGLRNRVLLKLALRQIPRRRTQTALVTLGLMLSTTIITTALGTGDTMSHAIRSVVTASLGRADEVIVPGDTSGWRADRRAVRGLGRGDVVASAGRGTFSYAEYERIARGARRLDSVAAMAPAIVQLRTVVDTRSKLTVPDIKLLAVPPSYDSAFGQILGPSGPAGLDKLRASEVYLNKEAADALLARAGDTIEINDAEYRANGAPWRVRVRDIVRAPGLAGTQASILLPLSRVWTEDPWWWDDTSINVVLVANKGDDESSVDRSAEVTRALRSTIADRTVGEELYGLMSAQEFRRAFTDFVREREMQADLTDEAEVQALRRLEKELGRSELTDEFLSLMGDPTLLGELSDFASHAWDLEGVYQAGELISRLHPLSVREIKSEGLARADLAGSVLTSIFLVLGLFSIAVGTMLVFLIWVMLAAERRAEMGTARAVGMQRRHLIQTFLFEGAVYSVLSSVCGVLAGVLVGRLAVGLMADFVRRYGVDVELYFAPRSLVIAFCLGSLLTFAIVLYCSWQVSRLNIVAAVRDLPEIADRRVGRATLHTLVRSSVLHAALLGAIGALSLAAAGRFRQASLWGLGITLLIVSVAVLSRWLLARARVRRAERAVWTLAGMALLAFWSRPIDGTGRVHPYLVGAHVEVYVLAGVLMVLGAVWIVVYNLPALLRLMERTLGRLPRAAAILRTAIAYPQSSRLRTGIVLAMFALVIFTMVVGSVLTSTVSAAYSNVPAMTGGFQLTATSRSPIPDVREALRSAPAIRPETFTTAGSLSTLSAEALRLDVSPSIWRSTGLTIVDDGWLRGAEYAFTARAPGYGSDADVWRGLRDRPGLAVAVQDGVSQVNGSTSLTNIQLPMDVWLRDPRGGKALRLTVIALLDPRSDVSGVLTSEQNVTRSIHGWDWSSYAFKVAPGADVRAAALGLELSFSDQLMTVDLSGEQALRREAVRIMLNYLLTGFMGLGLIVGIAALGVIATRAVVERRRQIATLRAVGFRAGAVQLGLLLEASTVAALGILLGVALGLVIARNLVAHLSANYPELVLTVPWTQVVLLSIGAWASVLLTTVLPAWQAARIPPAAGLRTT